MAHDAGEPAPGVFARLHAAQMTCDFGIGHEARIGVEIFRAQAAQNEPLGFDAWDVHCHGPGAAGGMSASIACWFGTPATETRAKLKGTVDAAVAALMQ